MLRADGTLWLNMGDSYASNWPSPNRRNVIANSDSARKRETRPPHMGIGLKDKDLLLMPSRVALALQADGWWLRSDIIWSKPNPMPESVTDRPTTAHEHVFLLTKAASYFYDAEAIREPHQTNGFGGFSNKATAKWARGAMPDGTPLTRQADAVVNPAGRNKRTVWEIATESFPGAHFATFAQALVEPCVLAGTSERGVCAECGAPWERVVERHTSGGHLGSDTLEGNTRNQYGGQAVWDSYQPPSTTGWRPTCEHDAATVPATVCDIFAGSGTVGLVAQRLGRRAVLIDASENYLALARRRIEAVPLPMVLEA